MTTGPTLDGTRWLVTGASRGIGRSIAVDLGRRGARLILTARDTDAAAATAELARAAGAPEARVIGLDLCDRAAAATLQERLASDDLLPDGLVNNAGFSTSGPVVETDEEALADQVLVNVTALLGLTRRLVPTMVERRRGFVLNVASIAAFQAIPSQAVYAATKAWVASFTTALREELRATGVHVTALCPGLTHTGFFTTAGIDLDRRFSRWGTWMEADDVARIGIRGVLANRRLAVPGFANRVTAGLTRFVPRRLAARVAQYVTDA